MDAQESANVEAAATDANVEATDTDAIVEATNTDASVKATDTGANVEATDTDASLEVKDTQVVVNGDKNSAGDGTQNVISEAGSSSGDVVDLHEMEHKINKQIEYYFGDFNLPRDRFLQEQIKLDDGWVPVNIFLKFNRIANMTKDTKVIATAIEKLSTLMEVSEDKDKVRRRVDQPLPVFNEDMKKVLSQRTLYVKGFPQEGLNLDALIEFFSKYGSIDNVQMRSYLDKAVKKWIFKGSVFVVFKKKEDAQKVMELESFKHNDTDLIRKWQLDYFTEKKAEREEYKMSRKRSQHTDGESKDAVKDADAPLPLDTIIHLATFTGQDVTREHIRELVESHGGSVAFIDFQKGNEEAWVRLDEENTASEVQKKMGEKVTIQGQEVDCRVLQGEEEEKYLEKVKEDRAKNKNRNQNRGSKRRGGGAHGRHHKRRKV